MPDLNPYRKPNPYGWLNPPIDGNYVPKLGHWTDLSELVEYARNEIGQIYEEPPGSDAGPLLEPMWEWVGHPPGAFWCAPYIVWLWGRWFKDINFEKKDPEIIKGLHALRQQFSRLGPANSSRLWKGNDKWGRMEGHDPRWVWYRPEDAISGEIEIRPGDLVYWGALKVDKYSTKASIFGRLYQGNFGYTGHVGMCTGEFIYDSQGKIKMFETIEGNTHNRERYGVYNQSIVSDKWHPLEDLDRIAGFLRYIGDYQGKIVNDCDLDFGIA